MEFQAPRPAHARRSIAPPGSETGLNFARRKVFTLFIHGIIGIYVCDKSKAGEMFSAVPNPDRLTEAQEVALGYVFLVYVGDSVGEEREVKLMELCAAANIALDKARHWMQMTAEVKAQSQRKLISFTHNPETMEKLEKESCS